MSSETFTLLLAPLLLVFLMHDRPKSPLLSVFLHSASSALALVSFFSPLPTEYGVLRTLLKLYPKI